MAFINIQKVSKNFTNPKGEINTVLNEVNLTINEGDFFCILGPSGCGKSTLLDMIGGNSLPTSGSIQIKGKLVTEPIADNISVFQEHALFPWLNVENNVRFGMKFQNLTVAEEEERIDHYLKLVQLSDVRKKRINELSGGMKQRVSLARALAVKPSILLMDEPFGALDEMTRIKLTNSLLDIWRKENITIVFVTHNINDAIFLGDEVFLMNKESQLPSKLMKTENKKRRIRDARNHPQLKEAIYDYFGLNKVH